MNAEQITLSFKQTDADWIQSGNAQKIIDTFEDHLELLPFLELTQIIVLGQPSPIEFAFLKHLVELFKKKHQIEDVFIQSAQKPNVATQHIESHGFAMIYDGDNIPGARPTIWSKITTSSVVIAPSVPRQVLHQAFKRSGFGILICTDINDIVQELGALNLPHPPGSIFDFYYRILKVGCKMRMPLLKEGESWCAETSIHWFEIEPVISDRLNSGLLGRTRMRDARVGNEWNQWACS